MNLRKITFTGADNSVNPNDLLVISSAHPEVEWGILFSQTRQGMPRYPGDRWLQMFWERVLDHLEDVCLSAHLCGAWVRDLIGGKMSFAEADPELWSIFRRVQINLHGHKMIPKPEFSRILNSVEEKQWILQLDGVNDELLSDFRDSKSVNNGVVGLFDVSGGAGVLPQVWPEATRGFCGYAGGLGPHNLQEELKRIADAAGDAAVWIDMETWVRSDGGRTFDLDKVKRCIEIATPYLA